jgi:hypothetical protein
MFVNVRSVGFHSPVTLQHLVVFRPLFQFLNLLHSEQTPWMGDQPDVRPLATHRTTQIQNKRTQYIYPCPEWDSNPLFERAKTVHTLDRAATVVCQCLYIIIIIILNV